MRVFFNVTTFHKVLNLTSKSRMPVRLISPRTSLITIAETNNGAPRRPMLTGRVPRRLEVTWIEVRLPDGRPDG